MSPALARVTRADSSNAGVTVELLTQRVTLVYQRPPKGIRAKYILNDVKPGARHPALYELNTRVQPSELSVELGRAATLDDISSAELDRIAELGFDWIWLLGVWQTGEAGRRLSRTLMPDVSESEICGSPFAIVAYSVSSELGGDAALARLRARLADRGMRLMLDFVPNHTAIDHPWMQAHPEFYIRGSVQDLEQQP